MKKKLYEKIQDDILKQINTGLLKEGDKLPTEKQLMEKYGVSRVTINAALKELKVNKIIKTNTINGTFVCNTNKKREFAHLLIPFVGILPTQKNSSTEMLDGIQKVATANDCIVPFYNTMNSPKQERDILKKLLNFNIDALMIFPCLGNDNIDLLSLFAIKQIPLIFIDRRPRGFMNTLVTSNNFRGLEQLVQLLINKGHHKIATAILSEGSYPEQERFNGYVSALLKNKIPLKSEYFLGDMETFSKYHKKSLFQRLSFLNDYCDLLVQKYEALEDKPEIICCANDNDVLNLYAAFCRKYDGSLPNGLILTGFDNLNYPAIKNCPTIEQNFFSIGKVAIEVALQQIMGKTPIPLIEIDTKVVLNRN